MSSRPHHVLGVALASAGLVAYGAAQARAQIPQSQTLNITGSSVSAGPAMATPQIQQGYAAPEWGQNAYPGTAGPLGSGQMGSFMSRGRFGSGPFGGETGRPPSMLGAMVPGGSADGTGMPGGAGGPGAPSGASAAGEAAFGAGDSLASGLGGGLSGGGGNLTMLGDQGPFSNVRPFQIRQPGLPPPNVPPIPGRPGQGLLRGAVLIPSIRNFKVSDNQSPRPQDRIYFGFSFYDDVNAAINQRFGAPVSNMRIYRETFGFEKTFWDQNASIGLRLPLDTLTANSPIRGLGGSSTALGDLAVIFKYAFWQNRDTGSLFSGGLLVSAPTGPHNFAGANNINSLHNAALQPWVGGIYNVTNDLYFHGFSSIDVPTSSQDVTMFYNDIGLGYYLYRAEQPAERCLTAVIPTFETHVNTPLSHRDPFNLRDIAGTPDVVDLTFGATFVAWQRSLLSIAYVNPVTGPRPFSGELLIQLNIRF
jgi:hypothetical protein